jgi:NADP-dependent 3-hydroxy acid dehydrogenase YdfG
MEIKGSVAVVTGASSGIGSAIARGLARDGAQLMLIARRERRLRELAAELGDDVVYRAIDVTDAAAMRGAVEAAVERFGRLDVLVNNAGVQPIGPLTDGDVDAWSTAVDTNIKASCTASPRCRTCWPTTATGRPVTS